MNAQQLRNSILQMAVQGKLVSQDPNEEPASVLLERIRAEKEKLIKEGIIKKEKNPSYIFRGEDGQFYEKVGKNEPVCIADEVLFDIPDSWEWERFGNIMINRDSERIPLSVSERSRLNKIYDYYGASGIIDKVDNYLFDKPLLLIGEDGANLLNRSTPIAFIAEGKYWVNNHAHVLDAPEGIILSYIAIYINSISLAKYVTGTAQPKMNQSNMNSILVPVPPTKEQYRIIAAINAIAPYIENYKYTSEKLNALNSCISNELKKSILKQAVMGKLVPQDPNDEPVSVLLERIRAEKQALIKTGKLKVDKHESIIYRKENSYYECVDGVEKCIDDEMPFEIPDGWEWVRIKHVAFSSLGKTLNKSTDVGDNVPYLCSVNVTWDGINLTLLKYAPFTKQEQEKYKLKEGDLLICEGGDVGRCAIWQSEQDMYYQNALHCVRFMGGIDAKYIRYILELYSVNGVIKNHSKGVTIKHLVQSELYSILFPLPPIEEQNRIVSRIEELIPLCKSLAG